MGGGGYISPHQLHTNASFVFDLLISLLDHVEGDVLVEIESSCLMRATDCGFSFSRLPPSLAPVIEVLWRASTSEPLRFVCAMNDYVKKTLAKVDG